ncbi:uncharacterized protein BJ171DRAFT_631188 [Polychytrium aggregatum]|uniref:uncharacterized protein n=1 Tax=Polychytrium aggregatum TaxID=110093 RepID=UPI0022FF4273|nr:uncharacterized protein BJ171DRAFT_631188 [Polychytrium aggregatum]KAI9208565.1 hypothetical protein BJ171DRAFT_631188 [Polychytrium aggregatum]
MDYSDELDKIYEKMSGIHLILLVVYIVVALIHRGTAIRVGCMPLAVLVPNESGCPYRLQKGCVIMRNRLLFRNIPLAVIQHIGNIALVGSLLASFLQGGLCLPSLVFTFVGNGFVLFSTNYQTILFKALKKSQKNKLHLSPSAQTWAVEAERDIKSCATCMHSNLEPESATMQLILRRDVIFIYGLPALICVIGVGYGLVVNYLSPSLAAPNTMTNSCNLSTPEFWPVLVIAAVNSGIVNPLWIYLLWSEDDNFGIKRELMLSSALKVVSFIAIVVWWSAIPFSYGDIPPTVRNYFQINDWVAVTLIIESVSVVLIPTFLSLMPASWRPRRAANQASYNNWETFMFVLGTPELFQELKSFAVQDFCVENVLFYEEYQRIIQKAKLFMISLQSGSSDTSANHSRIDTQTDDHPRRSDVSRKRPASRIFSFSKDLFDKRSEDENGLVISMESLITCKSDQCEGQLCFDERHSKNPLKWVPHQFRSDFTHFYRCFISKSGHLQVNLPNAIQQAAESYFCEPAPEDVPIKVFDDANSEVLLMIFSNTFLRFINAPTNVKLIREHQSAARRARRHRES